MADNSVSDQARVWLESNDYTEGPDGTWSKDGCEADLLTVLDKWIDDYFAEGPCLE